MSRDERQRPGPRSLHGDRPNVGELPVDEDVRREVAFHIEMRTRELIEDGWEPGAARAEAERLFGNVNEVEAEMRRETKARDRSVRRAHALDGLVQDLKFAFRLFRRSPGFTLVAILTLALGIGANTAIFSLVNGVLLKPLPYPDSDEIVRVLERNTRGGAMGVAWPNYLDWQEASRSLEHLAVYAPTSATILGGDRPLQTTAAVVSREFFQALGVSPLRGRGLTAEDHREGADPAAVVSHSFWQNELGAPDDLSEVTLETGPFTFQVVGVMPPELDLPAGTDLWSPVELRIWGENYRTAHNYFGIGRLAEGVPPSAAQDELSQIVLRVIGDQESPYLATGARVERLQSVMVGDVRRPLYLLLGAAALVLLVACSNLASTFLARATNRERELAVRASVGAGQGRLVRQLFTEALVLSGLGAGAGLLLAHGVVRGVVALAPPGTIPRLEGVGLDPRVVAFTVGITVLTAALFGLFPALRAARTDVGDALRSSRRGSSGRMTGVAWRLLVGGQVALALVLLAGSGLLIRSVSQVLGVDPGFEPERVVTVDLSLPATRFGSDSARVAYFRDLERELEAIPGAAQVAIVDNVPLGSGMGNGQIDVEGGPEPFQDGYYQAVSGDYFSTMGIPLIRGRSFDDRDHAGAEHVAIVNQAFAEIAWPGEDPIGKRITGGGMDSYTDPDSAGPAAYPQRKWARVVGVVGNVRHRSLTGDPPPIYYFHHLQRPRRMGVSHAVVKAQGDPRELATPIREAARRVSPDVPVDVRVMNQVIRNSVGSRTFTMAILGAFALSALLLAGVGIYGVVSYSVARRTREMGIRLAMGARPGQVRSLVQRGALTTVILGAGAGVLGALAMTRFLRSLLYEVSAADPLTFGAVTVILVGTAWLASWIPARRTTKIDPMVTMNAE